MTRAAALIPLLALAACAVGPNYVKPATAPAVTAPFASAAAPPFTAAPADPAWWRLFDDPALDPLIQQAFAANTDLRVAAANLDEARAALSEQLAGRLPSTTLTGSASRIRTNGLSSSSGATTTGVGGVGTGTGGTGAGTGTGGTGGTGTTGGTAGATPISTGPRTFNLYSAGIDLEYEVDLFGRVSRSIEAARADRDQQAALLDDMRVTVAAETARAYADACAARHQLDVANDTVRIQRESFALTEKRAEIGAGSPLDVARARTLVEQTAANVPTYAAARRSALYRLAVLTGQPPATPIPAAEACKRAPEVRVPIPTGDGAALLARRPDVRAAERALAAATARIGVATAALYPQISLGASGGTSATKTGRLFTNDSFTFNLGPLISWSFPNIAVARAEIRQAEARTRAQLATFDGTVLTALRDTETALDAYARELERRATLQRALANAREAARILNLRYGIGSESQLDVLDAERTRADAELQLAASEAQLATDRVQLFKALGGGWETAPPVVEVREGRPTVVPASATPPGR